MTTHNETEDVANALGALEGAARVLTTELPKLAAAARALGDRGAPAASSATTLLVAIAGAAVAARDFAVDYSALITGSAKAAETTVEMKEPAFDENDPILPLIECSFARFLRWMMDVRAEGAPEDEEGFVDEINATWAIIRSAHPALEPAEGVHWPSFPGERPIVYRGGKWCLVD